MPVENNDLANGLKRGDENAFDAIFRAWYPALVRSSEGIVGSQAVAEELVQDVMLELWRRRESLDTDMTVQAYLFRATRNRSLNHVRHERVQRNAEPYIALDESHDSTTSEQMQEDVIAVAVRRAVAELPDRCREVFELSRFRGLKYSEIASALGISVKTVEAQMSKALRILREELADLMSA